jgi:hypothetical protein
LTVTLTVAAVVAMKPGMLADTVVRVAKRHARDCEIV